MSYILWLLVRFFPLSPYQFEYDVLCDEFLLVFFFYLEFIDIVDL